MNASDSGKTFRFGLIISTSLIGLMWVVKCIEYFSGIELHRFGINPKTFEGLKGILFSPFIHGDFQHLSSNSLPLLILITLLVNSYRRLGVKILVLSFILSGFFVWLLADSGTYHIGASGVVYALAFFLIGSGMIRKDNRSTIVAIIVIFLYGGMIWGIFPMDPKVSWQSHLSGALVGLSLSFIFKNADRIQVEKHLLKERSKELPFFEEYEKYQKKKDLTDESFEDQESLEKE